MTWPSAPCVGASLDPLPGAPFADAVALVAVAEEPIAWKLTSPCAVTSREVPAVTVSSEMPSASAMPTAVSVPCASPADDVVEAIVCSAFASSPAPSAIGVPVPIVAEVVITSTRTAMAGVTPVVPPLAPVFASVVNMSVVVACSARVFAAANVAPSSISADVVSVTTLTATAAPTPVFFVVTPSVAVEGSAFAVASEVEVALSSASPVPAVTTAPALISARVSRMSMLIAIAPATPTSPAPAPAVASASNVFLLSAPTVVMSAASVRPVLVTCAPAPMVA